MRFALTCLLFWFLLWPVWAADTAEIEVALVAIGNGSAEEIKTRLCTDRLMTFNEEAHAEAIAALPDALRRQRLTDGKLLRRVEPILQRAMQTQGRTRASQQPELFLFTHELPTAQTWRGAVLLVSSSLVEALYDGELAGVLAHELSHAYFEDEMAVAQREHDTRAMRIVELKCDGVAIVSVQLLGYNPTSYLSGLQRLQQMTKRLGRSSSVLPSHPDLVVRAQFSARLLKALSA